MTDEQVRIEVEAGIDPKEVDSCMTRVNKMTGPLYERCVLLLCAPKPKAKDAGVRF